MPCSAVAGKQRGSSLRTISSSFAWVMPKVETSRPSPLKLILEAVPQSRPVEAPYPAKP